MRKKRLLVQNTWYEVRTAINNRKPLLRRRQAIAIFCRVLGEAQGCFAFEARGLRLEEEWLSFYIRPADGLRLPTIMQWLKQTFLGSLQCLHGEKWAYLGRPVLVTGAGRGTAGRDRRGGLGGGGCCS